MVKKTHVEKETRHEEESSISSIINDNDGIPSCRMRKRSLQRADKDK